MWNGYYLNFLDIEWWENGIDIDNWSGVES